MLRKGKKPYDDLGEIRPRSLLLLLSLEFMPDQLGVWYSNVDLPWNLPGRLPTVLYKRCVYHYEQQPRGHETEVLLDDQHEGED